jgi:hypothetical protein
MIKQFTVVDLVKWYRYGRSGVYGGNGRIRQQTHNGRKRFMA